MKKITEWRHHTGRSRMYHPKGEVNYRAVAIAICKRYFSPLWNEHQADCIQECNLLELEAEKRRRIIVSSNGNRRVFGNSSERMGIKSFSRACFARLHDMAKRYEYFRPKGSKCYYPRKSWNWGLDENYLIKSTEINEVDKAVLEQIQKQIPSALWERAIRGDEKATAAIHAAVWGE